MTDRVPGTPPADRSHRPERPDRPAKASPWPFAGMVGLAVVLFLDLTSLTFLPGWAVAVLVALWLVLLVLGCRWFVTHPRRVALLPVVGFAAWAAAWAAAVSRAG